MRDIAASIGIAGALAAESSTGGSAEWTIPPTAGSRVVDAISQKSGQGASGPLQLEQGAGSEYGLGSTSFSSAADGRQSHWPSRDGRRSHGIGRAQQQPLLGGLEGNIGDAYREFRDGYAGYPLLQINVSGGAGVENGVVGGGTVGGGGPGGTGGSAATGARHDVPAAADGGMSSTRSTHKHDSVARAPIGQIQKPEFNVFEVEHQFNLPAVAPDLDGRGGTSKDPYAVAAAPAAKVPPAAQVPGAAARRSVTHDRKPVASRSLWDRYRWLWALLIAIGAAGVIALISWAIASSVRADNERARTRRAQAELTRQLADARVARAERTACEADNVVEEDESSSASGCHGAYG